MNETMEKKLNFNAPLLSTRRQHHNQISSDTKESSNGIPFCWEQAPGKPKNLDRRSIDIEAETPRPKPPPGRWRRPPKQDHDHDHDQGCDADADVDVHIDYDNHDVFSDDMEVLSLTEAIDIVEKKEEMLLHYGYGSSSELDDDHHPSPNFIMERFLPDAAALAASSSSSTTLTNRYNNSEQTTSPSPSPSPCVSQSPPVIKGGSSFSWSPKRCGLEILLPWRMKMRHSLCGVKTPVKEIRSNINIMQPKTSCTTKHKKLFASIVAPSAGEWRCK